MHQNQITYRRIGMGHVLLVCIIFVVYSNTFNATWHMDDVPNITQNPALHIKDLSAGSIAQTFFAKPNSYNVLYRPVACLTFALNWYLGKDNVFGYHVVNITIHALTAMLLFLAILNLFKSPKLKGTYQGDEFFIALLAACLWALNPLQTQAVTYIVQRMASMAAMFYVLGIYLFIKARLNASSAQRVLLVLGCVFSFLFAIGSKENAATLPFALFLMEITFFKDMNLQESRNKVLRIFAITIFSAIIIGALIFLKGDYSDFLRGYEVRSFTLSERILTEPRILIFYLSLFFSPLPQRLSFQQDINVSISLLDPWTTMPAILLVNLLIVIGIFQIKKQPIFAFGFLFFFLNHIIESTILPLELYFEHRNYLPTLFLFWPVAEGLKRLLAYFQLRTSLAYKGLIASLICILIGLGMGTYIRNAVWATEKSLWEDVRKKAPGIARPYQVLAEHNAKAGKYDVAYNLYEESLFLKDPTPIASQAHSFNNMGNIQLHWQNYEKAIALYQAALEIYPGHEKSLHNMTLALVKWGRWEDASAHVDLLIARHPHNEFYFNLQGLILIKRNRYQEAKTALLKALKISPRNRNAAVNLGIVLSLTGKTEKAANLFKRVQRDYPRDLTIQLALIENHLRAGDESGVERALEKLWSKFSVKDVISYLNAMMDENRTAPLSLEIIAPAVAKSLKKKSDQLNLHPGAEA